MGWIKRLLELIFKPRLSLPHPREPQDLSATVLTVDKTAVLGRWLSGWHVLAKYHDYWLNKINLYVYDAWPPEILTTYSNIQTTTPGFALSEGQGRAVYVLASWLGPGVIAHEQAHNSYALLTESDRAAFEAAYNTVKDTDPLIRLLYSQNQYGLTSIVEGHAEVYRYLGERLPDSLKRYYPKLF